MSSLWGSWAANGVAAGPLAGAGVANGRQRHRHRPQPSHPPILATYGAPLRPSASSALMPAAEFPSADRRAPPSGGGKAITKDPHLV